MKYIFEINYTVCGYGFRVFLEGSMAEYIAYKAELITRGYTNITSKVVRRVS